MNFLLCSLASQIKSVVHLCSSYLESGLDLENCVDILSLADTFSLQKLRPQVWILKEQLEKIENDTIENECKIGQPPGATLHVRKP